jgi:hypothetical protein
MSHTPFWRVEWEVNGSPAADLYTPASALARRISQAIANIHGARMVMHELLPGPPIDPRRFAPERGTMGPMGVRNPTLVHHGKANMARWHVVGYERGRQHALADLYIADLSTAKRIGQELADLTRWEVHVLDNRGLRPSLARHKIRGIVAPKRNPRSHGEADEDAATELELFIDNDADLYRQQYTPILKNLWRKMVKGTYDHEKAVKLWGYLVESGAKKYNQEFGGGGSKWHEVFSIPTRLAVARRLADSNRGRLEAKEFDFQAVVPAKRSSRKAGSLGPHAPTRAGINKALAAIYETKLTTAEFVALVQRAETGSLRGATAAQLAFEIAKARRGTNPSRSRHATLSRKLRRYMPQGFVGKGSRRYRRAAAAGQTAKARHHLLSTLERGRFRNPNVKYGGGVYVNVTMTKREVQAFKARWPVSGLPDRAITFVFDTRNGDLVGYSPINMQSAEGSGALVALSQDAWEQAKAKNPRGRGGPRIVYNRLLGGWYVVVGPHQTPLNGRFNSKLEAEAWLRGGVGRRGNPKRRNWITEQAEYHRDMGREQFVEHMTNIMPAVGRLRSELILAAGRAWDREHLAEGRKMAAERRAAMEAFDREFLKGNPGKTALSVPEKHQLRIARATLKMNDVMARVMGGMTKDEAREVIRRLTGREPKENNRGRRTRRRRSNPSSEVARARRTFRKWHGFDSSRVVRLSGPDRRIPSTLVKLGDVPEFVYRSNKWEGKPVTYSHKTKRPYPVLATDPQGKYLYLVGGRTKVTADGLVH